MHNKQNSSGKFGLFIHTFLYFLIRWSRNIFVIYRMVKLDELTSCVQLTGFQISIKFLSFVPFFNYIKIFSKWSHRVRLVCITFEKEKLIIWSTLNSLHLKYSEATNIYICVFSHFHAVCNCKNSPSDLVFYLVSNILHNVFAWNNWNEKLNTINK